MASRPWNRLDVRLGTPTRLGLALDLAQARGSAQLCSRTGLARSAAQVAIRAKKVERKSGDETMRKGESSRRKNAWRKNTFGTIHNDNDNKHSDISETRKKSLYWVKITTACSWNTKYAYDTSHDGKMTEGKRRVRLSSAACLPEIGFCACAGTPPAQVRRSWSKPNSYAKTRLQLATNHCFMSCHR